MQAGQLAPDAATDDALNLLSVLHFGVISQHLANGPDSDWETGRYTRLYDTVIDVFVTKYRPIRLSPGDTN